MFTCHVDSPKVVVETAEQGAACTSAATTPARPILAPKGYLTGAEWNWEKVYTDYVDEAQDGQEDPEPASAAA